MVQKFVWIVRNNTFVAVEHKQMELPLSPWTPAKHSMAHCSSDTPVAWDLQLYCVPSFSSYQGTMTWKTTYGGWANNSGWCCLTTEDNMFSCKNTEIHFGNIPVRWQPMPEDLFWAWFCWWPSSQDHSHHLCPRKRKKSCSWGSSEVVALVCYLCTIELSILHHLLLNAGIFLQSMTTHWYQMKLYCSWLWEICMGSMNWPWTSIWNWTSCFLWEDPRSQVSLWFVLFYIRNTKYLRKLSWVSPGWETKINVFWVVNVTTLSNWDPVVVLAHKSQYLYGNTQGDRKHAMETRHSHQVKTIVLQQEHFAFFVCWCSSQYP